MTFITLNRPGVYTSIPIENGKIERELVKQKPVTINPKYIVSMVEHFDSSKKFKSTELYLSNGIWYDVTSRIEEIIEMIEEGQSPSENHNVFTCEEDLEEAYQYYMKKNFGKGDNNGTHNI